MPVRVDDPWINPFPYESIDWEEDKLTWKYYLHDLPPIEFLTKIDDIVGDIDDEFIKTGSLFETPLSTITTAATTTIVPSSLPPLSGSPSAGSSSSASALTKYQLRNHDCMWSGRCIAHPDKTKCNNGNGGGGGNVIAHSTPKNHHLQQQPQQQQKLIQNNIPAGRSLLLNSRLNQSNNINNNSNNSNSNNNKLAAPSIKCLSAISTQDLFKDDMMARPDTPLSLSDDPPEFKHNIDLATCTMGSNRMSLINNNDDSSSKIITMLKEHLEDSTSDGGGVGVHIKTENLKSILPTYRRNSLTDILDDIKSLSDYEEPDDDDDDGDDDSNNDMDTDSELSATSTITPYLSSQLSITSTSTLSSASSASSTNNDSSNNGNYEYHQTMHSDHSYTRCKTRVDVIGLGVQTPSDSEEEIDVVSVGDKTLPTNPSAKDRRALQTTVAHKISARIVKTTPKGIKTIPPRRRVSDEITSTTATASIVPISGTMRSKQQTTNVTSTTTTTTQMRNGQNKNTKMSSNQSKLSQFADPMMDTYAHQMTPSSVTSSTSSRKRPNPTKLDACDKVPSSKKAKGKKNKSASSGNGGAGGNSSANNAKTKTSDSDEHDTIEKRNLHNDMERQRRIGLKNLFEELKWQIPSIKDKERAPKVSILREAAALCHSLNREHDTLILLKKQQVRLLNRVRALRTSLATQRTPHRVK